MSTLHDRVHLPSFFIDIRPRSTLEQWLCWLCSLAVGIPKLLDFSGVSGSRGRLSKVLGFLVDLFLGFDCIDETKDTLRRECVTDCVPKWTE